MKAQLAASNPELRNDRREPYGGGVLPGTYDLSILDRMEALEGRPLEDYNRLGSINDLPLIGADTAHRPGEAARLHDPLARGALATCARAG